jgi:death-on-curing protein
MNRFDLPDGEDILFPVLNQIHDIHERHALKSNNPKGILDEGKIQGALSRPRNALCYGDEGPDLITLAAYLWHGISEAHGYEDGNKRAALLSMIAFLGANGITYDAPEYDIGRFVLRLYKKRKFTIAVLVDFLRRYCRWTT